MDFFEMPQKILFLSYNSSDRAAVASIRQLLELKRVDTFFDCVDLPLGSVWHEALEKALREVRAVAVFVGPAGLGPVQKRELYVALSRQIEEERKSRSFPVIPVMLPGSQPDKLSAFGALNTWLDLRGGGVEADEQLERLVRSLNVSYSDPDRTPMLPRTSICPYRALEVFREDDFLFFFGRAATSRSLLNKVLDQQFVAVVGASGSGKSSLVQAGLVPLLRQQRPPNDVWEVIIVQPQAEPFFEIALQVAALLQPSGHTRADTVAEARKIAQLLLEKRTKLSDYVKQVLSAFSSTGVTRILVVVDQFEQLFTHGVDQRRRQEFVDSLLEVTIRPDAPAKLLITLRADFLQPALQLGQSFIDRLNQGIFTIGPLSKTELREAIEGPARRVGLGFESGLIESVLQELGNEPGELALLEFAMTELWNRRHTAQGGCEELTIAAFHDIGRVHGAVAARAQSLLPHDHRQLARLERALLRLVHVAPAGGSFGADARRVVKKTELPSDEWELLDRLVQARLLVAGSGEGEIPVIQVAHETLIRHWSWFSERIGAKRQFLLWRQNFQFLLEAWEREQAQSALLPLQLQLEAENMLKHHEADLSDSEKNFIEAGMARRSKANRRTKIATALATFLIIFTIGYAFWIRSTYHVIPEAISRAETLIKSDNADQNWFEALALVDRSAAWGQAKLISDRGDVAIAIAGILAAIDKQTPGRSAAHLLGQIEAELPSNYPGTWKLLIISSRAASNPDLDTCRLLRNELTAHPDLFKSLLMKEFYQATLTSEALTACNFYKDLEVLSDHEKGSTHRLRACIKLRDESCIDNVLSQFRTDPRSGFGHELPQFYGWLSVDARKSRAFNHFAQTSRLGKALMLPTKLSGPEKALEAFRAYQAAGIQVDLSSLPQKDSLLKVKLLEEFQEFLQDCQSDGTFSSEFADLSIQLGYEATSSLANCISNCDSNCPILSSIAKSRPLLIRVSRELRRRGNPSRAKELAWMALSPATRTASLRDSILNETTIPQIEELLPIDAGLQPGGEATVIGQLQREGLNAPWRRPMEQEILRWNLKPRPTDTNLKVALMAAQQAKPYNDSISVLIDAAFSWLPIEEKFAFKLADIAENLIKKTPVSDRSRSYCELSAFYSRAGEYSRALALSARSTSRAQQFHAYTQLLREYAIEEGLAKPDWWPSPPKLTRFDY